jgi:rhodanese-related sulfurtransferase
MRPLLRLQFFIFLTTLCACQSHSQSRLGPDAFQAALAADSTAQLVDVRTPDEFNGGHLAGAFNINYNSPDFAEKIEKLDKNRPVMVYCAVGGRSAKAAAQLEKMGFRDVKDLEGGINAWRAHGKPTEQ